MMEERLLKLMIEVVKGPWLCGLINIYESYNAPRQ